MTQIHSGRPTRPEDRRRGQIWQDEKDGLWVVNADGADIPLANAVLGLAEKMNGLLAALDTALEKHAGEDTESFLQELMARVSQRLYDRQELYNDKANLSDD